ncbi:hypothetical protein B4N89_25520 [Embleya scabrispora]|uniref:Uncharacterized protein n=1 Tax=Embleya scabrispora TaxID=159449 RepID=A0A1T3P414_9ACTN|nr:hypothetical protein B4N89_25520 [Embleya scabrispora]
MLVGLLFEGAAVGDLGRVRHRLGDEVIAALLADKGLTPRLRSLAALDPDPWVRRAVATNSSALTSADLGALLEQPDPVVDRIVYAHPEAAAWMRRVVLAPGRYPDEPHPLAALHAELLALPAETALPRRLGAAVVADRPELVVHALRVCAGALTVAEELRGLLSLQRFGGDGLLAEAVRHVRPEVAALADGPGGAQESGGAHLAAAVAEAEGAVGLIAELRAGIRPATWRRGVDWAAVTVAHRDEPLPEAIAVVLAADDECPEELLVALYTAYPTAVGPVARPTPAVLRAAIDLPKHPALARIAVLTRDSAEPGDVARIIHEVTPARTAVATLLELPDHAELRELLHRRLGAHGDRWHTLRAVLPRHRATLPALLAEIAAGTITAPAEPVGGPPPTLTKPYRYLLTSADPDDLREVLPALPDALVRDLLSSGSLPRRVHEAAIASTDPRAWEALARNIGLDVRELARLVDKRVPAVDAAAYMSMRSTPSLRRTIARRAPLDPGLRKELLAGGDRRTLLPLVVCGEPELAALALGFGCRKIAQQYAYIRVWERHGPEGVRELLDATGTSTAAQVRKRVEAALKAEDGLADLRASGEPYDDPATLPNRFQTRTSRTAVRDLVHEPYAHDFPLLMAANRVEPFAYEALDDLIRHEDATDADRASLQLELVNFLRDYGRRAVDFAPREWLRTKAFNRDEDWANAAVEHGLLDPVDLVDVAYPAHAVVASIKRMSPTLVVGPMRDRLTELTRDHLAGHTEALAIAVGLVEEFNGSLAELVTLAGQAAGPRPDAEEVARADAAALVQARREAAESALTASVPATASPATPAANARRSREREAEPDRTSRLVAVDLLRTLAGAAGGDPEAAPVPDDPAVLAALASLSTFDAPGYEYPGWLYEACFASESVEPRVALGRRVFDESVANDLIDLGEPEVLAALGENKGLEKPTADRVAAILAGRPTGRPAQYPSRDTWPGSAAPAAFLRWIRDYFVEGRGGGGEYLAEGAYRHGIVGPTDILGILPTRALTPLPRKWRSRIVAAPIDRAVGTLVADRLGVDPDRWLRALTAMGTAGDRPITELLETAVESEPVAEADREAAWQRLESPHTVEAAVVWEAEWRVPRAWLWPAGDLLLHASAEALVAILPRLGPHAYPSLWAYSRHIEYSSRALDEYPFLANDHAALRIVATHTESPLLLKRLLGLDDPELNRDLYGSPLEDEGASIRRVVLSRVPQGRPTTGPDDLLALDPDLRAQLLMSHRPTASLLSALRLKVEAADPEIVEHALRQLGRKVSLSDRLIGARGLLRHGGADRIGALVEEGVLGATAGRLVAKALTEADPDATLTARIDRERSGDKLVAKLRRCTGVADTDEAMDLPYIQDWDLILAEHEREPFPREVLSRLVLQRDSPARLLELGPVDFYAARRSALLDPAHARASIATGRSALGDATWYTHLDDLVTRGHLTGRDLVHKARGAATILRWIAESTHRLEVPTRIRATGHEARTEIESILTTTKPHWPHVYAALTAQDPTWHPESPTSTIHNLLTRTP